MKLFLLGILFFIILLFCLIYIEHHRNISQTLFSVFIVYGLLSAISSVLIMYKYTELKEYNEYILIFSRVCAVFATAVVGEDLIRLNSNYELGIIAHVIVIIASSLLSTASMFLIYFLFFKKYKRYHTLFLETTQMSLNIIMSLGLLLLPVIISIIMSFL